MRSTVLLVLLAASSQKDGNVSRCQRALNTPLSKQGDLFMVSACAPLFRPACRDALGTARKGRTVPEALAIVDQCGRAYCADMPAQPLCKPDRDRAPSAVREQFRTFVAAALAGATGPTASEADVVGLAMATELIPSMEQRLRVSVENGQLVLALPDRSWRVPDPPQPAQLAQLTAELRTRMPDPKNGGVVIEGMHALSKPSQRAIGDAISAAGYQYVACRPDMSNCR